MSLDPGTRLGPYEIRSPLGAGGMGEVYRARDTRLDRDVAIKVLPQHLSEHAEVRARFEREARTVSSLNHPNICTLFDVGREGDVDYLVMELVEGETLADKLSRGPLPLADVIRLGTQIADALDRAHRAGIVHRDLKPGNVMLTKGGAKLMDFGLARSAGLAGSSGATGETLLTHSPTVGQPLTAEGTIVGTFQYMSPEQLEGKEADTRSDLWALGCVLYEMATGKRAFDGSTQASLISAIMRDTPRPLAELAPLSPPALEKLVVALLAKDPDERVQTAHDVKLQLQWMADATPSSALHAAVNAGAMPSRRRGAPWAWVVAALALVLAGAGWWMALSRDGGVVAPRTRLLIPDPENAHLVNEGYAFMISPSGDMLTFTAVDTSDIAHLWVRPLDTLAPRRLDGTEHAEQPFWSPDGQWIAFFANEKLKRVRPGGGRVETLCDAPDPRGGAWGSQDVIVFAPIAAGPLYRISADGGTPSLVTAPDSASGESALRFPVFLPDGKRFLTVSLPDVAGTFNIHLGELGSSERRLVARTGGAVTYAEPGFLITLDRERLVALGFDADRGEMTGETVTIGDAPLRSGHDGVRSVSASNNGVLAYWGGKQSNTQLIMLNRSGGVERTYALPAGLWGDPRVSPDGTRAVIARGSRHDLQLWMVDVASGQVSRLTYTDMGGGSVGGNVVWSPDGTRMAYTVMHDGPARIVLTSTTGGEQETLVDGPSLFKNTYAWSPDGRTLIFEQPHARTGWDVWRLDLDGDRTPQPFVQTPSDEGGGAFSPDGKWYAYYTDESGTYQLVLTPFPGPGSRFPLAGTTSRNSSSLVYWSPDGREIIVWSGDAMQAIPVDVAGGTVRSSRPRILFRMGDQVSGACPMPDHQRFLATVRVGDPQTPGIVIEQNWTAALDKR
jgi:Tol biopolymer transport system component